MQEIALKLDCSVHRVDYWRKRHAIPARTRSEASYIKHNGLTDPFTIKTRMTPRDRQLYGLGVGIYWGEGNKKNPHAVRVGNTDPLLVKTFVMFLKEICGVKEDKIRYSLQVFTDVSTHKALKFWQSELGITRNQITPTVTRTQSGKIGTYKTKNQHGVITVYVFNKKLRDWLVGQLKVPR